MTTQLDGFKPGDRVILANIECPFFKGKHGEIISLSKHAGQALVMTDDCKRYAAYTRNITLEPTR